MGIWIHNLESVWNKFLNVCGVNLWQLFSQLVCVPYEWRLKILFIVIINAAVSVLTEVRNSNRKKKNTDLLSVFLRGLVCFCLEGFSSQNISGRGPLFSFKVDISKNILPGWV